MNPKSALRLNLNTTRTSLYHEIYEINGLGVGSVEKINSLHQFSFGYEGHKQIKTTNLYTGIEGIVGFGRNDEYGSRTDSLTMGPIPLPTRRKIYCVLRSPHVNKDSREHFEVRVHKRIIDVYDPSSKTIDALMKLELPSGVEVEIKV